MVKCTGIYDSPYNRIQYFDSMMHFKNQKTDRIENGILNIVLLDDVGYSKIE